MIFTSTATLPTKNLGECLQSLGSIGLSNIELSGGTEYESGVLTMLLSFRQEFGFQYLVHNYFPPPKKHFVLNLASQSETSLQKSLSFVENSIALAANLGVDRYSIHAGYLKRLQPGRDGSEFVSDGDSLVTMGHGEETMFNSIERISHFAAKHDLLIALENLFPINRQTGSALLCTPDDINRYFERISDLPNVGLLLDLAHLMISSNVLDFEKDVFLDELIDQHSSRIFGIHLSDNDGVKDLHLPIHDKSWPLLAVSRLANMDFPITLESRGLTLDQIKLQLELIHLRM